MKPVMDDDHASYRCVTPRALLKALKTLENIISNEGFVWKKLELGIDGHFYIHFQSCFGNVYDLFGAGSVMSDPDFIKYDDEDEYGSVLVGWKSEVDCY